MEKENIKYYMNDNRFVYQLDFSSASWGVFSSSLHVPFCLFLLPLLVINNCRVSFTPCKPPSASLGRYHLMRLTGFVEVDHGGPAGGFMPPVFLGLFVISQRPCVVAGGRKKRDSVPISAGFDLVGNWNTHSHTFLVIVWSLNKKLFSCFM